MAIVNIGPCGCCNLGCCPNPPQTLHVTITATGDCGCWAGSFNLTYNINSNTYENNFKPCGYPIGGFVFLCEGNKYYLISTYQNDEPTLGAGCILGLESGNIVTPTSCSPFYLEFTASVLEYLGATCCSGSVTVIITE